MTRGGNSRATVLVAALAWVALAQGPAPAVQSTGIEFWAVDLDNIETGAAGSFGLAVTNAGTGTAAVEVHNASGLLATATVAPGAGHTLSLPRAMLDGTIQSTGGTYRLTSDQAVSVVQFNPLDSAFTNDASMLVPAESLGTDHMVVTREHIDYAGRALRGAVTVVGTQAETSVTVTVTAPTAPGPGIPALAAGSAITRTLGPFEALNLESASGDLTGTRVTSDKPVAVFGSHECALIPRGAFGCDHLEEQMPPADARGVSIPYCRSATRGFESDRVTIVATQHAGTAVRTDPVVPGAPAHLAYGERLELSLSSDTMIDADLDVAAASFLVSSSERAGTGDPSMINMTPSEFFRRDHVFVSRGTYDQGWVSITAIRGSTVTINGTAVSQSLFTRMGNSSPWACARVRLSPGTHRASSDLPFGLTVYGWSDYASYGYAAGPESQRPCDANGLDVLLGTPAQGVGSGLIRAAADDVVAGVDPHLAAQIHKANCEVVVPLEDSIDATL